MMKGEKIILSVVLLCMASTTVAAMSVGSAPGVYDLGRVKAGTKFAFKYYLMTNSRSDILVSLGYAYPHKTIYSRNHSGSYTFIPSEASEESVESWVSFPRNPILVSPAYSKIVHLERGGVIKANAEVDVIMDIPDDAEPGYHTGSISLSPRLPRGVRGTGITTIAVTRPIFVFRVDGDVIRRGEIQSILADREGNQKARITTLFKNTGTVSMSVTLTSLKLYDNMGNFVVELDGGQKTVKPGEITDIPVYWTGRDMKPGTYRAEVRVTFIDGFSTFEDTIIIPEKITIIKKIPKKKKGLLEGLDACGNVQMIISILVIIILVLYLIFPADSRYRNIILMTVAALIALSTLYFVLTCLGGLSWLSILLILIIAALIIYLLK